MFTLCYSGSDQNLLFQPFCFTSPSFAKTNVPRLSLTEGRLSAHVEAVTPPRRTGGG